MEDARGIFRFEDSFADDLRFMPLSIRYRLDLAGLKLKLEDWLRIPVAARDRLLRMPAGDGEDIAAFKQEVLDIAASNGCRPPAAIGPLERAAWRGEAGIPEAVLAACAKMGRDAPREAWAGFTEFRRYALFKLACSEREPGAFAAALGEILGD
jgi:hypothetical protein